MPKVTLPTLNRPREYIAPTPDADAFGAATGRAVQGVGAQLDKVTQEILQQDNETRAKELDNEFSGWLRDRTAAYKELRGRDAYDGYKQYKADLEKKRGELLGKAGTDEVRRMVSDVSNRRIGMHLDTGMGHAATERRGWLDSQNKARVSSSLQDAIDGADNPTQFNTAIATANEELRQFGTRNGKSPEEIDGDILKFKSDVYTSVVAGKMETNPIAAREYYLANRENILPTQRTVLDGKVQAAAIKQEGADLADKVFDEDLSYKEMNAAINKATKDQEIRDEASKRLRVKKSEADADKKDAEEERLLDVFNKVSESLNFNDIPSDLPPDQQRTLEVYIADRAAGKLTINDDLLELELRDLAAEDPAKFASMPAGEFLKNLNALDPTVRKSMISLRQSAKQLVRTGKVDDKLKDVQTDTQIINSHLKLLGIKDKTKTGTARTIAFKNAYEREVRDHFTRHKVAPTSAEKAEIAKALTIEFATGGANILWYGPKVFQTVTPSFEQAFEGYEPTVVQDAIQVMIRKGWKTEDITYDVVKQLLDTAYPK